MSRKESSFSQLLAYMEKGSSGEREPIFQHLHSGSIDEHTRSFEDNARLLRKRKNGVFLYHEILSFKNNDTLAFEEKAEKLQDIAREYLCRRSEHALAYGVIHEDKTHHTHVHLCISSNALNETQRVRLSKKDFSILKVEFERWVLKNYPELEQAPTIEKEKGVDSHKEKGRRTPHTPKGGELKRRTGRLPKKEILTERFRDIFRQSTTKEAFFERMSAEKLDIYTRGNTIGFTDTVTGRKHRLKTLGLEAEFQALSNHLDLSGKGPVIDYTHAKGQSERVDTSLAPQTEENTKNEPRSDPKQGHIRPKREKPARAPQEAISEPAMDTSMKQTKEVPEADQDTSSVDPSDAPKKKFGRFGTLKEWLTGDFTERSQHQKNQSRLEEEAKRQARFDARYEARREKEQVAQEAKRQERAKEAKFNRVEQSTKERVRRSTASAEVEARKQIFKDARAEQERSQSKDGKDGLER